jgi:CheY-like chemotaxis protein
MSTMPASILVIDPDSASRNYLATMLEKSGYTVITTSSGKEGLIMAWRDQPSIIILDPVLPDLGGLELVTRLRQDRRTAQVPVVALSSRENSQEMSALIAAGCSEYLVKSTPALQKLMEFLPRLVSGEKPVPKKEGKLIVFLSAKGGTGTSSLCANIAMCLASDQLDKKVAVVDMVLPIGSIAHIVGSAEGGIDLVSAAALPPGETTRDYFAQKLPRVSGWSFHLLAGASNPEASNHMSWERVGDMIGSIRGAYDYVFVDLGRSLSRISMPVIQQANIIALILSTDRATADLTLIVWDYLKTQGIDPQRMYAIQNRAVGLEGLTRAELEKMIGLPVRVTMPYMGDNFTVANNRHEPIAARSQGDSSWMALRQAANEISAMGEKPAANR